jgi:hypothetical protein
LAPKRGEITENVLDGPPPPSDRVVTTDRRIFRYMGPQARKIWRFVGDEPVGSILTRHKLCGSPELECLDGE